MAKTNGAETIIAHGVRVEGDFISESDILIEGEVVGSIKTTGDLRVGDQAQISGTVTSQNAFISGRVEGNVSIVDRLEISSGAVIVGDLSTTVISISAGAKLNGTISMDGVSVEAEGDEADDEELE